MTRMAWLPCCVALLVQRCTIPDSSHPYFAGKKAEYLAQAKEPSDIQPFPPRPSPSLAPPPPAPSPPPPPERAVPGELEKARTELEDAARDFRAELAKMEKPWFVLMVNRPLDLQSGLLPRTKTVKTVKRDGKILETIEEEVHESLPLAAALREPDEQFHHRPIEVWLDTGFRRAGCDLRDTHMVWVKARGERSAPTIEDLRPHADLLISVTAACQAAQTGGQQPHVLSVRGSVVELASGRILAGTLFRVEAASPAAPSGDARGGPPGNVPVMFDIGKLEQETLQMTRRVLAQVRESWAQGVDYHLAVSGLASQGQVDAIRRFLADSCRATDVKIDSDLKPPRGGGATFHFKSPVKPCDLVDSLQRPNVFESFRLEIGSRRYSTISAACVHR